MVAEGSRLAKYKDKKDQRLEFHPRKHAELKCTQALYELRHLLVSHVITPINNR